MNDQQKEENIPVGLPVNDFNNQNLGYNYQQQQLIYPTFSSDPQFRINLSEKERNTAVSSAYIPENYHISQNTDLIIQPEASPVAQQPPRPPNQPYVSKWQKLAQLLNQDDQNRPQVFGPDHTSSRGNAPLLKQFSNQSKPNPPQPRPTDPALMTPAQRMQVEIEEHHKRVKEQQDRMMNFVAPKTVGPKGPAPLIEQSIPTAAYNQKVPVGNYVIHKIIPNETLDRISIIYNVPKDAIRKANGFTGDEIYMKRELIIPNSYGPVFKANEQMPKTEEQKKKDMIDLMSQHLREKYGGQANYKAEAQYYLEVAEYNFQRALKEFEEDLKFEKEQENKFRGLKEGKNGMQPLLYLKK